MHEFNGVTIKNLNDIRNYIIKNYPDSCIAQNDELNGPTADPREMLKEISEFFKHDILGFCDCGCPLSTEEAVKDYLYAVNKRTSIDDGWDIAETLLIKHFGVSAVSDNSLLQFMAYVIDNVGFTEHGTSINGAWIEDLGRICLYVFDLDLKVYESEEE